MRRLTGSLVALSLLLAACSQANRHTVVPEIPDELPPAETTSTPPEPVCLLGFGTGKGAEVLEVVTGVPAESVLAAGDVVVAVDGRAITDSTQLIAAIQSKEIGDTITVGVDRGGREFTGDVRLVEHTDNPGAPMAGISIRTAVDLVPPGELETVATTTIDGLAARVAAVEGRLFAVDPLRGAWEPIADTVPEATWAAVGGAVYTLEDTDPDVLIEVTGGARLDLSQETWNTRWVLGSVGTDVLVLAERPAADGFEAGVLAIDPATGDIRWEYLPGMSSNGLPLVPVLAVPDPSQQSVLVALTELPATDDDAGPLTLAVIDSSGSEARVTGPADGAIPADSRTIGWHDEGRVGFLPPEQDRVIVWEVATGAVADVVVPRLASASELVPVGDGEHFIMATTTGLDLVAADTVRPLAVDCVTERISALGYGS